MEYKRIDAAKSEMLNSRNHLSGILQRRFSGRGRNGGRSPAARGEQDGFIPRLRDVILHRGNMLAARESIRLFICLFIARVARRLISDAVAKIFLLAAAPRVLTLAPVGAI